MAKEKIEVKAIMLKNYHLPYLIGTKPGEGWLDIPLHGKEARARNRVVSLLAARMQENEKERIVLLEKYGKKDKDNVLVMDEKRHYQLEDQEGFAKDFDELMNTDAVFDILPSNKEDFKVVAQIILEGLRREFNIEETQYYDEMCKAFEKI